MIGCTDLYDYNINALNNPSHSYANNELSSTKYNIFIDGDFKGFDNSRSVLSNSENYLYMQTTKQQEIPGSTKSSYKIKYYLEAINNWGTVPIETLTNFCINASGLIQLPDTPLPNVNQCMSTFMNCVNLYQGFNNETKNMKNFQLPLNAVNCKNMFTNTNINYDFTNINVPAYLTNIAYMFYNTQIIGINTNIYNLFPSYYAAGFFTTIITGNYFNAFPNSISTTLSTEFDEDYFKKILSPH